MVKPKEEGVAVVEPWEELVQLQLQLGEVVVVVHLHKDSQQNQNTEVVQVVETAQWEVQAHLQADWGWSGLQSAAQVIRGGATPEKISGSNSDFALIVK